MNLLVDNSKQDDRLEHHEKYSDVGLNHRGEIAVMVLDLPGPQKSEEPAASVWLFLDGYVSSVPRLVDKEDDEAESESVVGQGEPERTLPTGGVGDNEAPAHGPQGRRGEVQEEPDADLAGVFVVEEDIFDVGENRDVAGGDEGALQGPQHVESRIVVREADPERQQRSDERRPEQRGGPSPVIGWRDHEQSSDSTGIAFSHRIRV